MAYKSGPLNNTKPATYTLGMWNFIQALLLAGWAIKASGDGLAAYSSTGSVFTNGGATGANGFDNSGAWLRIAYPGTMSGRELCIIRGTTTGNFVVAISPLSKFITGGDATHAASATDQQFILGNTFTAAGASALFSGTIGQNYYNAFADDAAPYTFYAFGFAQGNGADNHMIFGDALTNLSSGLGGTDPDPYVYGFNSSNIFSRSDWVSSVVKGFANGTFGGHVNATFGSSASSSTGNPFKQGQDLLPFLAYTTSVGNSSNYVRGFTTMSMFNFHNATQNNHAPMNYNGGTFNKIQVGMWVMPWDGSAIITS